MLAVVLLYRRMLTRVEEVVLQVSPDQEDETLQAGRAEADLQGLAGNDGGHLVERELKLAEKFWQMK